MTKSIKFVITTLVFFKLKMHQNPAGGAYDAPSDPLVGWGGGYPLPIPLPLDAFGVSKSAPWRLGSQAPLITKTGLRQWFPSRIV